MPTFNVTYQTYTPEASEQGDFASHGVEAESLTLREARDMCGSLADEADCFPISTKYPPRWLTFLDVEGTSYTGTGKDLSLHFPKNITPSSAVRVARLFGVLS